MAMIMCVGLDANLYSSARVEGEMDRSTEIVTLQNSDLPLTLAEITSRKSKEGLQNGKQIEKIEYEQAFVIFDGPKSSLNNIMKGFKRAYKPEPGSIIFAMLTETARTWTLQNYLEELGAEHREMRQGSMRHEQNNP